MINSANITGRLVRDPDLRYTPNGVAVANFTVAVDDPFNQDKTNFINCVAWKKTAENLANYQKKGSLIGVSGRIETRSFDNQEGKKVFVVEVVANQVAFLDSKPKQENQQQQNIQQNNSPLENAGEPVQDDDLPF